jgi:hypothetical protein
MLDKRTNILICGVSRSGSHALVDLFSEYDNIGIYPGEFDAFRAPGMVADQLDEELRQDWPSLIQQTLQPRTYKSRIAQRFFSNPQIQKLESNRLVQKLPQVKRRIDNARLRDKLTSLDHLLQGTASQEEKLNATKEWIQSVGDHYCYGNSNYRYFLFDQPLTLSTNLDVVKKVFEPFKMICSLRDPKDQIANVIKDKYIFLPYGAPRMNWGGDFLQAQYGRTRKGAFEMWINDINIKYKRADELERRLGPERFKVINFESLVQNYDETVADLERFIGLQPSHHVNKRKYFNPEISAKNIGYHSQYLKPEEYAMLKDLERMYDERFPVNNNK